MYYWQYKDGIKCFTFLYINHCTYVECLLIWMGRYKFIWIGMERVWNFKMTNWTLWVWDFHVQAWYSCSSGKPTLICCSNSSFQVKNTRCWGLRCPVVTLCRKIIKLHFQYSSLCVMCVTVRTDIRPVEEFRVICRKRVHFLLEQLYSLLKNNLICVIRGVF